MALTAATAELDSIVVWGSRFFPRGNEPSDGGGLVQSNHVTEKGTGIESMVDDCPVFCAKL